MRYVLVTAPTGELVTLDEAKEYLRVTREDEDDLIQALIRAAVGHFDGRAGVLGRALLTQTWRIDAPAADCGRIAIRMPNVSSIVSIKYLSSEVETTWITDEWRLGSDGNFFFVEAKPAYSWPAADDQEDAYRVTFVAGYGNEAEAVPAPIKAAVLLLLGHLYSLGERNLFLAREEIPGVRIRQWVVSEASGTVIKQAIDALTAPYRVRTL